MKKETITINGKTFDMNHMRSVEFSSLSAKHNFTLNFIKICGLALENAEKGDVEDIASSLQSFADADYYNEFSCDLLPEIDEISN